MNRLHFLWRITERYLWGHRSELADIARDYDRAAATYAETWQAFMAPVNREFLEQLCIPMGGKILDLGCGTGMVLDHLRQCGFEGNYSGIDASSEMLLRLPKGPGVELHQGDVHELLPTIADETFDVVTALWSWEYLDRQKLLPHIRRVLSPGGQVALLANRRDTVPELKRAFLRLMERRPDRIRKVFHLGLRMPRTAVQMVRELTKIGFEVSHSIEGEQIRHHETADEAVAWGFRTGALAGTRCVLDLPTLDALLAEIMAADEGPFTTTHRYAGVVGVLA